MSNPVCNDQQADGRLFHVCKRELAHQGDHYCDQCAHQWGNSSLIAEARFHLGELKATLEKIKVVAPSGRDVSYAGTLSNVLKMMDFGIKKIETFLG